MAGRSLAGLRPQNKDSPFAVHSVSTDFTTHYEHESLATSVTAR